MAVPDERAGLPGAASRPSVRAVPVAPEQGPVTTGDVLLGAALAAGEVAEVGMRVVRPAARFVLDPPLVPDALTPRTLLRGLGRRWQRDGERVTTTALREGSGAVAEVATQALDVLPLPDLVDAVMPRLDLTRVVDQVLGQLDVQALLTDTLAQLDLQAIVVDVVKRLDLQPVVEQVLAGLNLQALVEQVLPRLDLQALVEQLLPRLDLGGLVRAVLDEVDLTEVVLTRVDLAVLIDAVLDRLDLDAVARTRLDLPALAEEVIDAIDLPAVISESTGSLASESVRSVRMQSADADAAVSRLADRLLLRFRSRNVTSGAELEDVSDLETDQASRRSGEQAPP